MVKTKVGILKLPFKNLVAYIKLFSNYLGARMYLIFALSFFATFFEGIGFFLLAPLMQNLEQSSAGNFSSGNDSSLGNISSYLNNLGITDSPVGILALIACTFLLKAFFVFGSHSYYAKMRSKLVFDLKDLLFSNYCTMSYGYYVSRDTGYFTNVINTQIDQTLVAFKALVQVCVHILNAIIYITAALVVAWSFGLTAVCASIVLLYASRRINGYILKLSRLTAGESGNLSKLLIQALQYYKYLKISAQVPLLQNAVRKSIDNLSRYEFKRALAAAFTNSIQEPIAIFIILIIVICQVYYFKHPLAPIMVSILMLYRGLNSIMSVQSKWQGTLENIGSLEVVHKELLAQRINKSLDGDLEIKSFSKSIRLANVSFSYSRSGKCEISDVDLEIKAKAITAIIGQSGSGKSTLVDLISLLLTPTRGEIYIDGILATKIYQASWGKQIGYVSQDIVIFNDSIANNICMHTGGVECNGDLMERVVEASREAHLLEFIQSLPDGFQTSVGDRGLLLSGGQRQRLSIARELFRKPSILILDEATSALDSESENAIQSSIDELKGKITVLIIAHRLSTIRNADAVIILDAGQVKEAGPFPILRKQQNSELNRLLQMQKF